MQIQNTASIFFVKAKQEPNKNSSNKTVKYRLSIVHKNHY
jgi:hypothetical protein